MAPILIIHHHQAESRTLQRDLRAAQILNPLVQIPTLHDRISYFSNLGAFAEPRFPCVALIHARTQSEPFTDIARSLRRAFQTRTVPILIAGENNHPEIAQAFLAGISTFLLEPLASVDLTNILSRVPRLKVLEKTNGVEIAISGTQPTIPISYAPVLPSPNGCPT